MDDEQKVPDKDRYIQQNPRRLFRSTDSSVSTRSISLDAALITNLALKDKLEAEASAETPEACLKRMLSIKSVVSTSSSFAARQKASIDANTTFKEIGTGSIGKVFEHPGTVFVYKLPLSDDPGKLWNNYKMHQRVKISFETLPYMDGQVEIPECFWYATPDSNAFWDEHINNFSFTQQFPKKPRHYGLGTGFFSLRNFKLHANQIEELNLDMPELINALAHAMAVLHWHTRIDGNDVEFVLGSSPMEEQKVRGRMDLQTLNSYTGPTSNYEKMTHSRTDFGKRLTSLWMVDFDDCGDISMDERGIAKAVKAFIETNHYCPRPNTGDKFIEQAWRHFGNDYLSWSAKILEVTNSVHLKELPRKFLIGVFEGTKKLV